MRIQAICTVLTVVLGLLVSSSTGAIPAPKIAPTVNASPTSSTKQTIRRQRNSDTNNALDTLVVNIRRDTAYGLPYGSAHSTGISSIVWGTTDPSATGTVTLSRSGSSPVSRTVTAEPSGHYAVSVDRLVKAGDTVEVSTGSVTRTVQVPAIDCRFDSATMQVSGTAPTDITSSPPNPHSLQLAIGGQEYAITTSSTGTFSVSLDANPYLAGLLGSFCYITAQGDRVYEPAFAADPLVRGRPGDWRADIILGQPQFSEIVFNEVVSSELFNPGGIHVDRTVNPNRVYVYDAGNNRVLGLSHLGTCTSGENGGQPCTSPSDCPSSVCDIEENKQADIVLGQPSFNTSSCNGDSAYQHYPDVPLAGANTLCTLPEHANSVSEAGSAATMATDDQGNLYVPDFFNHRVLRYDTPFSTDTVADFVWGQGDFHGTTCNRGAGFDRAGPATLCLAPPPGFGDINAGVAVDSDGNLWVADNHNNRVLRFSLDPLTGAPEFTADLVLGQPDFYSVREGSNTDQMRRPASVRVRPDGLVYVADYLNDRILVFEPPLSSGMDASEVIDVGDIAPRGLEFDPGGGLWVNDDRHNQFVLLDGSTIREEVPAGESRAWGGMGVDRDNNLLTAGWDRQEGIHLSAPDYSETSSFLGGQPPGLFNKTGARGLYGGKGLEVTPTQLIYGDGSRILFWNSPWTLSDYEPADGVVEAPDFQTRKRWGPYFERMRADSHGRLWVLNGTLWTPNVIVGYHMPLETGAQPAFTLSSPLPILGRGVFTWTKSLYLGGIEVQPECDCLWLSDEENHRVFRIRNVSTSPVVDIVLGQESSSGKSCNQGRGRDEPSRDSLCNPGGLAFDPSGNLYVSDHNLEFDGNHRLLEFDAATIPSAPSSAVFGIPATRVLGRDGDFSAPHCLPRQEDPLCAPLEPAFDSQGRMVVGFNGYLGPRFPVVYKDPLKNPLPVGVLAEFHSMPTSTRFDRFDNLYVLDHNRSRILIYRDREIATYQVRGVIRTEEGDPVSGVEIRVTAHDLSGNSNSVGEYTVSGLVTGTYTIVPSKAKHSFIPASRTVSVPPDLREQDFTAHPPEEHEVYLPVALRQH